MKNQHYTIFKDLNKLNSKMEISGFIKSLDKELCNSGFSNELRSEVLKRAAELNLSYEDTSYLLIEISMRHI